MNKLEQTQAETLFFMARVINARKDIEKLKQREIAELQDIIELTKKNGYLDPVLLDRIKVTETNRKELQEFAGETVDLRKLLIQTFKEIGQ